MQDHTSVGLLNDRDGPQVSHHDAGEGQLTVGGTQRCSGIFWRQGEVGCVPVVSDWLRVRSLILQVFKPGSRQPWPNDLTAEP